MSDLIPPELIPPGVNDARSRAFAAALGEVLAGFSTSALLIQDPWTVPASLLPAMTLEAGLSEFVSPGMREELVRELIAAAPEIHAMTGTVAGARRALEAVGISVQWTQWFQMMPPGGHDTHRVFLFLDDTIIAGEEIFAPANQAATARIIRATQRWSQDIEAHHGVLFPGPIYLGATAQAELLWAVHPYLLEPPELVAPVHLGATIEAAIHWTIHPEP